MRSVIERIDTSLIEEWEGLRHPDLHLEGKSDQEVHRQLALEELMGDEKIFRGRIRAEFRLFVRALAQENWDDAGRCISSPPDVVSWTPERLAAAMAPYYARYEFLRFDHEARLAETTIFARENERRWKVTQRLLDPEGDDSWWIEAVVDLSSPEALDVPLIQLERITSG